MYVWKTLKVFVSSTFKDLELERDRLARVFHSIKEEIFRRQLSLIPYDLRWRDRHQHKDVAKWCLEKVEQCQYFVNILGYRYGWRPEKDAEGNANTRRISVTEMEIDKALAVVPRNRRFFCLGNFSQYSEAELARENAEDLAAVKALRERLYHRGERVFEYRSFDELLGIIHRELKRDIDADYDPKMKVPPEEHSDANALQEIIAQKALSFVGREKYLDRLSEFAMGDGRPNYLAVHALAGTGKSAILARFIALWREMHPEIPIVAHFLSMKKDSGNVDAIMRNLARQLSDCGLLGAIETEPVALREQVRQTLEQAGSRIVLAIDGVDEVSESGAGLLWLSRILPPNVRVILTTRPAGPWEILCGYPHLAKLELPPLDDREIEKIIADYTGPHELRLAAEDAEDLRKRAAGNPLFLKVALDEILSTGIAVGQLACTIEELFQQILARLQKKYGKEVITDYLGCIAAAYSGISEGEIRELLDPPKPARLPADFYSRVDEAVGRFFKPIEELQQRYGQIVADYLGLLAASRAGLPEEDLRPLLGAGANAIGDEFFLQVSKSLENFIVLRGGLLTFFHPEFERSIKMWLGKGGMRAYHRRFADYLRQKGYGYTRTLGELPYQEQWGERMEDLLSLLSDLDFLEAKSSAGMTSELCEDFRRSLTDPVVPLPKGVRVENYGVGVTRETIGLLEKAMALDIQFLRRHPACLFQTLWNRCYWYDSSEAEGHYEPDQTRGEMPWQRAADKVCLLVEKWREQKERRPGFTYIKSRKPLLPDLGSPLLKTFKIASSEVNSAVFTADASLIVTGSKDHMVRIWDAFGGECLYTLKGHTKNVSGVAVSPDDKKIASASWDGTVRLWDTANGESLRTLELKAPLNCIAFSPDGEQVICGADDGKVYLCSLVNSGDRQILMGHYSPVTCVAVRRDGRRIASGSEDSVVQVWDMAGGENIFSLHGHEKWVHAVAFSPDGRHLVSASEDNTVRMWDMASGNCLFTIAERGREVLCVAFSPDGSQLAVGSSDKHIGIWDMAQQKYAHRLKGHEKSVYSLSYSRDGAYLVSASSDQTVRVWDATHLKDLPPFIMHQDRITSTAMSQDEAYLASASYDRTARIWDVKTGKCLWTLCGHEEIVSCVSFSHDSALVASGSFDNTARIWDIKTGKCLAILAGHNHAVLDVEFSPDNAKLATASYDRTLRYYSRSGECLAVMSGHKREVMCAVVSADGCKIASGSADNTVKLWDTQGKCLCTMEGHKRKVYSVYFSRDMSRLTSHSEDGTTRIWEVASGKCVEERPGCRCVGGEDSWEAYTKDSELAVLRKSDGEAVAFFPEVIRETSHENAAFEVAGDILHGGNRSGYVYLMEVRVAALSQCKD